MIVVLYQDIYFELTALYFNILNILLNFYLILLLILC